MKEGARSLVCVTHNWRREGAQLVLAQLARLLSRKGWAVRVGSPSTEPGPLLHELPALGIPVHSGCTVPELQALADAGARILVNTAMLWEFVSGIDGRLAWVVHESGLETLSAQLPGLVEKAPALFAKAAASIFVCEAQLAEFAHLAPSARRIYNGLDLEGLDALRRKCERQEIRKELGLADSACLLVTVGTPKPRKGQAGVVRAARALGLPVAVVGCVGSGSYEEQLQAESDGSVHLIPRGGPELVTRYLVAADVYVCNSELESFPLGILEAMGCGLPVVSADCGGIREQIQESCGNLLPACGCNSAERAAALHAALEPLAKNPELRSRMGAAGRSRVEELFSEATMVQAYDELLGSL